MLRIALLFAAYISLSTSFQLVQAGPSAGGRPALPAVDLRDGAATIIY